MTTKTDAAVAGMLPNGRANSVGPDVTIPEDQLDKGAVRIALKAIDKAYDIQWGKDGIEETKAKLNGLMDRVSEQVYSIVKAAVKLAGNNLPMARSIFLSLCVVAENHIRSKDVEKNGRDMPIGQLIPSWSTYKSEMAKGLQAGIDPELRNEEGGALKYPTADTFRKAAQVATATANGTGSQAGQTRTEHGNVVQELMQRGFTAGLSAAVTVLLDRCIKLNNGQQDKAAKLIVEVAAEIEKWPAIAIKEREAQMKAEAEKRLAEATPDAVEKGAGQRRAA